MKTRNILLTAFAILGLAMLTTPALQAQTCDGQGKNFVDLNGDGFNDNAPDADGDGIPNGLDDDYIKSAQNGSGYKNGELGESKGVGMAQTKTMTKAQTKSGTMTQTQTMSKAQLFYRLQAFNGSLFQMRIGALGGMNGSGAGICDGTGGGTNGSGDCDGTGPKGNQNKGGK